MVRSSLSTRRPIIGTSTIFNLILKTVVLVSTGLVDHYECVNTTGQLTNTRRSDEAPELDGAVREVVR